MRTLGFALALGVAFAAAPAHAMLQIAVDVDGFTEHDSSPTGSLVVPAFTLDGVTVSGSLSQSFGTPRTPNGTNFLNTSSLQVTNSGAPHHRSDRGGHRLPRPRLVRLHRRVGRLG